MKTFGFLFLITALVLIAGCNPKTETTQNLSLADSLLKLSDDTYNSGDVQKMADLYANDGVMILGNKTIWSKDSIYAFFKSTAPLFVMKKEYKSNLGPTTISSDKIQMQRYVNTEVEMGGIAMNVKSLIFLVWEKQADNSWKIAFFLEFAGMGPN
jgi:ketosteroid isomerase-like protein